MKLTAALRALLIVGGLFAIYKVIQNARMDANETFLDGWQRTARNMRPTPKSAIELANEAYPRAPLPEQSHLDY